MLHLFTELAITLRSVIYQMLRSSFLSHFEVQSPSCCLPLQADPFTLSLSGLCIHPPSLKSLQKKSVPVPDVSDAAKKAKHLAIAVWSSRKVSFGSLQLKTNSSSPAEPLLC